MKNVTNLHSKSQRKQLTVGDLIATVFDTVEQKADKALVLLGSDGLRRLAHVKLVHDFEMANENLRAA